MAGRLMIGNFWLKLVSVQLLLYNWLDDINFLINIIEYLQFIAVLIKTNVASVRFKYREYQYPKQTRKLRTLIIRNNWCPDKTPP